MRRAAKTVGASSFKPGGFEQKMWWYERGDIDEQTATRLAAASAATNVASRTPQQLETSYAHEPSPSYHSLDDTVQEGLDGAIPSHQSHGDTAETQTSHSSRSVAAPRIAAISGTQPSTGAVAR